AVRPLRIGAVTAPDVERDPDQRFDLERRLLALAVRQLDRRADRVARAGRVPDLGQRPTELLGPTTGALGEHAYGEVRVAQTVAVRLEDDVQREVVEAQRDPAPPHAGEVVRLARRLRLAHGTNAPRAVAGRGVAVGRDRNRLAVDAQLALERTDAG